MKDGETVPFGAGRLDRSAELRGDGAALERIRQDNATEVVVLWRGKPLVRAIGDGREELCRLSPDTPVVAGRLDQAVFLGRDRGRAVLACDLFDWEPSGAEAADPAAFVDDSEQTHPDLPGDCRFIELRRLMVALSAEDAELAATAKAVLGWHQSHRFCAACGTESEVSMAGWQRTCPTCGAHHFPRTDPVVIMLITHGNSLLLGRSPHWPEGMFSLLAGFVEPGETIEAAVRREVAEETRVPVGEVRYLASQPWPFPSSLMFGCHGEALDTAITIDPAEIEDALWVTRERLSRIMAGLDDEIRAPRSGAIAHFLMRNWLADRLD